MQDSSGRELESSPNGSSSEESNKKTCADCGTTETPLWRGGPAGPKSLCNACGIRSRKKRGAIMGLKPQDTKKGKRSRNTSGNSNHKLGDSWKRKLFALGREVLTQRSSSVERQRNELGEEERAALLLMALSYGYFHLGREGKKK